MGKKIKILSIDGGGTRGLLPSTMLNCLEKETGQKVTDLFDVIVGSATGGIIAAALGAGMETAELIDLYLNRADFILPSNSFRKIWNPVNLFAPKYPNDNLKQLLTEKFGATTKMSDVWDKFGASTVFLLASLDLSPDQAPDETPSFKIKIFNSAMAADQSENLVDIALRTSAAAINLPIYQRFGEGGNYANDPAPIGFAFSVNDKKSSNGASLLPDGKLGLGANIDDIRLLSLGCGDDGTTYFQKDEIGNGNWGLLKWFNRLINLVIHSNMIYAQHLMSETLDDQSYLRINPYYKAADAPDVLRNEKLKIDVKKPEQLQAIKAYAEATFEKEKQNMKDFLGL